MIRLKLRVGPAHPLVCRVRRLSAEGGGVKIFLEEALSLIGVPAANNGSSQSAEWIRHLKSFSSLEGRISGSFLPKFGDEKFTTNCKINIALVKQFLILQNNFRRYQSILNWSIYLVDDKKFKNCLPIALITHRSRSLQVVMQNELRFEFHLDR